MPIFQDCGGEIAVSRASMLLDTGVFLNAFARTNISAEEREYALFMLNNPSDFHVDQWLVPSAVIVEAWGHLSSSKFRDTGGVGQKTLMEFVQSVTNAIDVIRCTDDVGEIGEIVKEHRVDVVDAILARLAERISEQCELKPGIRIATLDTSDFHKLKQEMGAAFRVFNARTLEDE